MVQRTKKTCSIDGCHQQLQARGWCHRHYVRWTRHGDPESVAYAVAETLEESFGLRTEWRGALLSWTGAKDTKGYGRISVNGKMQQAHRYAWERTNGPIPEDMKIDHKNHCDEACVNVDHLRLATTAQNGYNRSGAEKGSKSGIRNVHRVRGKWRVGIQKEGKNRYFGSYDDLDEAAEVAQAAREELFGA